MENAKKSFTILYVQLFFRLEKMNEGIAGLQKFEDLITSIVSGAETIDPNAVRELAFDRVHSRATRYLAACLYSMIIKDIQRDNYEQEMNERL